MYNKEKVNEIKKMISVLDNILEKDDFAIFGSGPMYIRDIKEKLKDLDIIVNQKGWNKLIQHYESKNTNSGFGNLITINNEGIEIEIFDMWGPGKWDLDELIKTSDKIEEVNFVTLENVLKWKKEMNREKDVEDIKKINEFLI
jgi:predicted nucleotidyltransferase